MLLFWYLISYKWISVSCLTIYSSNKLKPCGNFRKYALQVYANWNLTETRKAFLHCWNCAETYYIRFQVTETFWKLFSLFPYCWNLTETYYIRFQVTETFWKLFSMFPYCWNLTETNYIRFQLTETLRKLFSSFPHSWNLTETYTSGFRWRKLEGIQLNLYNSFHMLKLYRKLQLHVYI